MIRKPAVAGAFYPGDAESLKRLIESCFLDDSGIGFIPELSEFDNGDYPINVMVPHAGYQYSGAVASHGYCSIVENGFPEVFIILSPNHKILDIENCAMCKSCVRASTNGYINVGYRENDFIFRIETDGSMPPKEVLLKACEVLGEKADKFIRFSEEGGSK